MAGKTNRRKNTRVTLVPLPFSVLVVLIAALALTYLWLNIQCEQLGKDIADLRVERVDAERRCATEELKWSRMTTLAGIENILKRHHIVMVWPDDADIVRVRPVLAQDRITEVNEQDLPSYAALSRR